MKAAVLITVLNVLITWSDAAPVPNDQGICLVMTPEKHKQIKYIEKKISELLLKLENQIGDIIITDVTVNITKYSDDEAKKDINLVVSVNDCADVNKKSGDDVVYFDEDDVSAEEPVTKKDESAANVPKKPDNKNTGQEASSVESKSTSAQKSNSSEESSTNAVSNTKNSSAQSLNNAQKTENHQNQENTKTDIVTNGGTENQDRAVDQIPVKRPGLQPCMEVMILELDDKEEKLVREMEQKRGNKPFLLIEHSTGQREIKFI